MIRIGQGFDVHKFEEGRPLIIGGITIPHDRGLDRSFRCGCASTYDY